MGRQRTRGGRRSKDFQFTFRDGILYRLFNNGQRLVPWTPRKRRNVYSVPLHEGRKTRQRRHRRERNRRNQRQPKAGRLSCLKCPKVSDVFNVYDEGRENPFSHPPILRSPSEDLKDPPILPSEDLDYDDSPILCCS